MRPFLYCWQIKVYKIKIEKLFMWIDDQMKKLKSDSDNDSE